MPREYHFDLDNEAEGGEAIGYYREYYGSEREALSAAQDFIDHNAGEWESGAAIALDVYWDEDIGMWIVEVEYGEFSV